MKFRTLAIDREANALHSLRPLGYYLLAIHLAFLVGFVRFLGGRKEAAWQRAPLTVCRLLDTGCQL